MKILVGLSRRLTFLSLCLGFAASMANAQSRAHVSCDERIFGQPETIEAMIQRRNCEQRVLDSNRRAAMQRYYRRAQVELPAALGAEVNLHFQVVAAALVQSGGHWTVPSYYVTQIDCISSLDQLVGDDQFSVSQVADAVCNGGYLARRATATIMVSNRERMLRIRIRSLEREIERIDARAGRDRQASDYPSSTQFELSALGDTLANLQAELRSSAGEFEAARVLRVCVSRFPTGISIEACRSETLGDLASVLRN